MNLKIKLGSNLKTATEKIDILRQIKDEFI